MIAVTIDGYSLAAIVAVLIAIVIIVVIAARLIRRDPRIQVARWGFFIERRLFDQREFTEKPTEKSEWPRQSEPDT